MDEGCRFFGRTWANPRPRDIWGQTMAYKSTVKPALTLQELASELSPRAVDGLSKFDGAEMWKVWCLEERLCLSLKFRQVASWLESF